MLFELNEKETKESEYLQQSYQTKIKSEGNHHS